MIRTPSTPTYLEARNSTLSHASFKQLDIGSALTHLFFPLAVSLADLNVPLASSTACRQLQNDQPQNTIKKNGEVMKKGIVPTAKFHLRHDFNFVLFVGTLTNLGRKSVVTH